MTAPSAPSLPPNRPMVLGLFIAIGVMSLAIVVLFALIIARLLNPPGEEEAAAVADRGGLPEGTIDFAAAPVVEIGLPPGARVVETHISADRVTFEIETVQGERGVYTTPLGGFDQPVRLVFHTLE